MNTPTDSPKLYDFEAIARSMNGFDEIAVERHFNRSFRKLEDGTLMGRAVLFVQWRREGMRDADAYKKAMLLTIDELEASFVDPADEDEEDAEGKAGSTTE